MKTNKQTANSTVSPKVMSYIYDKPCISIKIYFFIAITKQNICDNDSHIIYFIAWVNGLYWWCCQGIMNHQTFYFNITNESSGNKDHSGNIVKCSFSL
jgi:hypothetical protein